MKTRYSVYIPTVFMSAGTQEEPGGSLLEVYAQPYEIGEDPGDLLSRFRSARPQTDQAASPPSQVNGFGSREAEERKALTKHWDLIAAPLRPAGGLHHSGSWAASMALKVGLPRPSLALYQKFRKHAYLANLRLRLVSGYVPEGWGGTVEGHSADLGLALALLLAASRPARRLVIATGRLGGQPGGTHHDEADVEVLSVGKLPEKLRLIERLALEKRLPRGPQHQEPLWVLTPTTFDEGRSVTEENLPEITRLGALGIDVIPVKTLRAAAQRLGARQARWMPLDYWAPLGVLACVLAIGGLLHVWWPRPLLMVTAPALHLGVEHPNHPVEDLAKTAAVFLDDRLTLSVSSHPGEFRYLLTLDGEGDAYSEPIPEGFVDYPMEIPKSSPPAMAVLMLVSDHEWSDADRAKLASRIKALHLEPELSGKRYYFTAANCIATKAPQEPGRGGPPVFPDKGAKPAACEQWAQSLLDVVLKSGKGIRLDGYAFEIFEP